MLGVERRQKIMEKPQLEQKVYVSELRKGITDKTAPQIGVDFPSEQGDKPKGYAEDLSTRTGEKDTPRWQG